MTDQPAGDHPVPRVLHGDLYEPAVWWLDYGTGRGRVPVRCGWWLITVRGRRWRPWRRRG